MRSEVSQTGKQSRMGPHRWRVRARGLLSLALAVCGVLSCEQAITVKGAITVPVAVQQLFSDTVRGRLVVHATRAASGSSIGGKTIFILCEPGSEDLILPYSLTKFACAEEIYAEAMVIPQSGDRHPDFLDGLPCGMVSEKLAGASSDIAIAYGRQVVFEGRHGGSCSATAVANITVALTEMSN